MRGTRIFLLLAALAVSAIAFAPVCQAIHAQAHMALASGGAACCSTVDDGSMDRSHAVPPLPVLGSDLPIAGPHFAYFVAAAFVFGTAIFVARAPFPARSFYSRSLAIRR